MIMFVTAVRVLPSFLLQERPAVRRVIDFHISSLPAKTLQFLLTRFRRNMSKRLFVGNLSYQTTENDLTNLFEQAGEVESASIITDRETGRSKGFAFVEMGSESAEKAITQLNGTEFNGRALTVNEARPREERSSNGGGRNSKGGGRGSFGKRY